MINRRKFLGYGIGILAAGMLPTNLMATNFRKDKPALWEAKTPRDAIKELFGTNTMSKSGVKLKAPAIAENGAVIPITIKKAPKGATTIAIFQDADPESATAVFTMHPRSLGDGLSVRIKMQKTGKVIVVAQVDGKLYYDEQTVKVTIGGCGG